MKTSSINLSLTKQATESTSLKKRVLVVRSIAIGFLFLTGSAAMVLFILISTSPLPNLRRQENGLIFQMDALHAKMGKHLLISNQLKDIAAILNTREDVNKTIDLIRDELTDSVSFDSFSKDEEGIFLLLSSRNLDALDGFLQSITRLTKEDKVFARVNLSNLSIDATDQRYIMSLEITPI